MTGQFAVLSLRRKLGWEDLETSPLEAVRGFGYPTVPLAATPRRILSGRANHRLWPPRKKLCTGNLVFPFGLALITDELGTSMAVVQLTRRGLQARECPVPVDRGDDLTRPDRRYDGNRWIVRRMWRVVCER
jgi:hypothetical protein